MDAISLPPPATRAAPEGAPSFAWNGCGEFKSYHDVSAAAKAQRFSAARPFNDRFTRLQRRAYFAAASFMDAQVRGGCAVSGRG